MAVAFDTPKVAAAAKPATTERRRATTVPQHESLPAPALPAVAALPRDGTLLVDGSGSDAQLPKHSFLALLRTEIEVAAAEELAGTDWTADQCPWLDYWFAYFATRSAHDVEATLRKYAPATAAATGATDYFPPVIERVRRAIQTWRTSGVIDAPDAVMPEAARVHASLGQGEPLAASVRTRMEGALTTSLGSVRIHADGVGARVASAQAATALTVGSHVAFAAGTYRPGTVEGDALLAHELAHTQQQRAGRSTAPDASLEGHADRAAFGALVRLAGGCAPSVAPAKGGLRLQRCSKGELPSVAKGKVPDYDSFSDVAGHSALTEDQASAWAAMFQNPDQLDRVFADAASGNARAKQVVADLHKFFTATGESIAEIEARPDCMIPAWHELKGAVSDVGCVVNNWSSLSYLHDDRPGGEALRTDIAKAYSQRSRELGIRNSVIANALTVLMVGWEMKAAMAGEAKALGVPRGSANKIPTGAASGEIDAVAKKTPEVVAEPKVVVEDAPQKPATPKVEEAGAKAAMHEGKEAIAESEANIGGEQHEVVATKEPSGPPRARMCSKSCDYVVKSLKTARDKLPTASPARIVLEDLIKEGEAIDADLAKGADRAGRAEWKPRLDGYADRLTGAAKKYPKEIGKPLKDILNGEPLKMPGDAGYTGGTKPGSWRLTNDGMGAHMFERANVKGRPSLAKFDQPGTPRYYPQGTPENAGQAHLRIHDATAKAGISLGGSPLTDDAIIGAYKKAYADPALNGIKGDLRIPGGNTLASGVTPGQAFDALLKWAGL